ncbi:hypothetical protein MXD59_12655 [Frankia sp. Ag45/Mut15]|uniref:Metal dependent phosphohydrolase n=1 Tax=Frankia umida TaxID=573489 RepID=A0ABT0K007_9ACTN|nr:hypothetical protein [Frankia umida]MCK9876618.1 hypothetical protein [Frankia umida]
MLTRPRSALITTALDLARGWCAGHVIDNAPALGHAVRVALTLGRHMPVPDALLAAVLLHDVPDYRDPDEVAAAIGDRCGISTLVMMWLIHDEHAAMDLYPRDPAAAIRRLNRLPDPVAAALAADKTVSLRYVLGNARRAADPAAYWQARPAFRGLVPYLRAFHTATAHRIPASLAHNLDQQIGEAEKATAARKV